MRLNASIVAASLCLVPTLGHAAVVERVSPATTVVTASAQSLQDRSQRADAAPQKTRAASQADDKARYAEKEAASSEAQDYRGGDTIVIGASAAVAILAVILLIVLI